MTIQCECSAFQAELTTFPKNTPGRLGCYCDDCQIYLHHLNRQDLLDAAGGTEIIPVYPSEFKILKGSEHIQCIRLSEKGKYRFVATCCNTPIGNTDPGSPWLGLMNRVFTIKNKADFERTLGPVKARVLGKFAKGTPPPGTSDKFALRDMLIVMPWMFKGMLLGKGKKSPLFQADGKTPIGRTEVLTTEQLSRLRDGIKT